MTEDIPYLGRLDRTGHVILVVDDAPASRYATARLLRSVGFQTREAASAQEALACADDAISAMVLDVHLPDIDGFELCRMLRTRPATARLPVMHLSAAYVTDEDKVRGLDAGADAYLTHPVEPAVLVATVQALVRTRAAEEALRHSEEKFRAMVSLAPSGICLLDPQGRVTEANDALLGLLQRPLEAVVGRPLVDFVDPAWQARVADCLTSPVQAQGQLEFPLLDATGRAVHVDWRTGPVARGTMRVAVVTDVSDRLQVELARADLLEREQAARTEAERVARLKDDLIAVLSHELRSPLNAMMGWTQVLQRRPQNAETLRGLQAIERNGHMQARLLADILDTSRIKVGKLELDLRDVDPAQLLAATLEALAPALNENDNRVRVDIEDDLGLLCLDAVRFQQIVWNLLSNANKFSPPGSEIDVSLRRLPAGGVRLSVADRGVGIDPAFLPFLFDRFTQGDTRTNRAHGGLGLGLSIVKHLVEMHGGRVGAHSPGLGGGAVFHVDLPERRPAAGGAPAETGCDSRPAELPEHSGVKELQGLRVLAVDDDEDAGSTLAMILAEWGVRVRTATSAAAALALVAEFRPHVLLTDLGMPDQSGYDLLAELRRSGWTRERLPAIAITGFNRPQDIERSLQAGFHAHLSKPLRASQLVREIGALRRGPAGDGAPPGTGG